MMRTTLIDVPTLQAAMRDPSLAILDCRFDLAAPEAGRAAYRAGHIPAARYADLERDLSGPVTPTSGRHPLPDPGRLAARFERLGVRSGSQVVVYDEANGSFAARAWWLLRWLKHPQVAVLDGGLKAWRAAGGPLEAGEHEPGGEPAGGGPAAAAAAPDPRAWVSSDELVELVGRGRCLLVDARAPERFAGTIEPIDPVAGHVPGAVNHPFGANLQDDGKFLPAAELSHRWRARLAGTAPADTVVMCGSGVTACHDLLAMEIAGLGGARLYAGSWSEWIRDPLRPIARG